MKTKLMVLAFLLAFSVRAATNAVTGILPQWRAWLVTNGVLP